MAPSTLFNPIPDAVAKAVFSGTMPAAAAVLLGVLIRMARKGVGIHVRKEEVRREYGIPHRTFYRLCRTLRDSGLVTQQEVSDWLESPESDEDACAKNGTNCAKNGTTVVPKMTPVHAKNGTKTAPVSLLCFKNYKNKPKEGAGEDPLATPLWDRLCSEYPKNVGQSDFQVFLSVVDDVDLFFRNLKLWKQTRQWRKDRGQFVPGLSKFVSDRLWRQIPKEMEEDDDWGDKSVPTVQELEAAGML